MPFFVVVFLVSGALGLVIGPRCSTGVAASAPLVGLALFFAGRVLLFAGGSYEILFAGFVGAPLGGGIAIGKLVTLSLKP